MILNVRRRYHVSNQLYLKLLAGLLAIGLHSNVMADANQSKGEEVSDVNPDACVVEIKEDADKKYVQQKVIAVPDMVNHDLRVAETYQTIKNVPLCNGDLLVAKKAYFIQDAHLLDGSGMGYNIYITDKGDEIIIKTSSTAAQKQDGSPVSHKVTIGQVMSGTGVYKHAHGSYRSIGEDNRFKNTTKTVKQTLILVIPTEDKAIKMPKS